MNPRHRDKPERRRASASEGNARGIERATGFPAWLVRHPNRLLAAFRAGSRGRRAA
jgi:hypothetical protein